MLEIVRVDGQGRCLVTKKAFLAGETITRIKGYRIVPAPTRLSIQVSEDQHIDHLGDFRYLNHSCRPTTVFRADERTLVARMDLRAGDRLTYFYPSTEWDMANPFRCGCGEEECLGRIAGARHLVPDVRERHYMNPHIRRLIAASEAEGAEQGERRA